MPPRKKPSRQRLRSSLPPSPSTPSSSKKSNGNAGGMLRRDPATPLMADKDLGDLLESGSGVKGKEKEKIELGGKSHEAVEADGFGSMGKRDREAMILLVVLYLLQGVPTGLAFGSIPFLLKSRLSYSQIGLFTLSTYPYSLKLLWSPIVDAWFSPRLGRRKSWIVPVQAVVGAMMWWMSGWVEEAMAEEVPDVRRFTWTFFLLIFFAATQDIAVDGWALTLLSPPNLSYASTAQTIGLNTGYFLSFTVFLAFNSVEFSNKYFRSTPLDYPLITLSGYLRFFAVTFIVVTAWLAFFKKEDPPAEDDPDMDIRKVYSVMYNIVKLKHVQSFIILHLVAKIGFQANDAVTSLKLLERGLSKEDLALAVLIDFPVQIVGGWLAARWSTGARPLRPWLAAFAGRLVYAVVAALVVKAIAPPVGTAVFVGVVAMTLVGGFTSTIQFVGISAFHTQIADPLIGGTYMTLLNTVSNLGGTWPRYFVLKAVDYFSVATCHVPSTSSNDDILIHAEECVSDHGKHVCAELGGTCVTERDGYYATSALCVLLGTAILVFFILPTARKLERLPASAWRVKLPERL